MFRTQSLRRLLSVGVAILAIGAFAPAATASPRSGDLVMAKECHEFTGQAGSFCTFTASNIKAIPVGSRIVYTDAAGATSLDTDVTLVVGPGGSAFGHCTLVFAALPGRCTFSGGTGKFRHFHATASVSVDANNLWHWVGSYSFGPKSDDRHSPSRCEDR